MSDAVLGQKMASSMDVPFTQLRAPGTATLSSGISLTAEHAVRRALMLAQDRAGPAEQILDQVLGVLRQALPEGACVQDQAPRPELTERQTRVLELLVQGLSNRHIARRMNVPEETVKTLIRALLDRLRVANRTALAMWAVREGIVQLSAPDA